MHGSQYNSGGDSRAVLDAIRRIVQALRESARRAEQRLGLSGAQMFVLQQIAAAQPLSVGELAVRTRTHQSSVSTVVTRLERAGLVRRERSARDARRAEVSLTPRGRRLAARAPDAAQARLIAGVEALSKGRRRLLASTLGELAAAVDRAGGAPAMFFEEKGTRHG